MKNTLQILFFGQLATLTGCAKADVVRPANTDELQRLLYETYPRLREAKYLVTLDRKVVKENTTVGEDAEIALLPPFSGG
ncbi:MoaD/ThiS family protein [uncultured Chitinophaga sp.]|uniref:MoaD/ThiS family protein n=1 Tax=uncultured Chitinophaga sp. TaxID=339340 RepID=UPI0025E3E23C|nr:MoaD/ThiS family protein [uncultured Chitinophaga sp.]